MSDTTQRLAKAIAAAGRASRRDAEKLIEAGRVTVNGKRVETPAFTVSASDVVAVDGEVLQKSLLRVWLYYKPIGLVTTARDEKGRKTIYDELPKALAQVKTVGRLDLNSEGLLLLTNNGDLKRVLELPETGWRRKYRVRAYGKSDEKKLDRLREGVVIDGEKFRPMEVTYDRELGDNSWYTVSLREGKNREIRRAFETVDLTVNRLIRVSYGPFQLGAMEKGEVSEMRAKALQTLLGGLIPEGVEIAHVPLDLAEENDAKPAKSGAKFPQRTGAKPAQRSGERSPYVRKSGSGTDGTKREQSPRSRTGQGAEKRGDSRDESARRQPSDAARTPLGERSRGAKSARPASATNRDARPNAKPFQRKKPTRNSS